jgi:hypothetical protein
MVRPSRPCLWVKAAVLLGMVTAMPRVLTGNLHDPPCDRFSSTAALRDSIGGIAPGGKARICLQDMDSCVPPLHDACA